MPSSAYGSNSVSIISGMIAALAILLPSLNCLAQKLSEEESYNLERKVYEKGREQIGLGNIDAAIAFYRQAETVCKQRLGKKCRISYPHTIEQLSLYKKEFRKSHAAADLGDWLLATKSFEKAYDVRSVPDAAFNTALAFDKAGGRELMAILWYDIYLYGMKDWTRQKDVMAQNQPRVDSARERLSVLDVGVESAISQLIRIAENILLQQPLRNRVEYMSIAKVYAALGAFDDAWRAYHLAVKSYRVATIKAKQAGYDGIVWPAYFAPEDVIFSIAVEQIKRLDFAAARRTADTVIPKTSASFYRNKLTLLRALFNQDKKTIRKIKRSYDYEHDESLTLHSFLFDTIQSWALQYRDGSLKKDDWTRLQAASIIESEMWKKPPYHFIPGSSGGRRYTEFFEDVGQYWLGFRRYNWLERFREDWRVLAKKAEESHPGETIENLCRLAQEMAEMRFFIRTLQDHAIFGSH